ncbi:MAG: cell division protein FtsZ [Chitinophagaceae bacterium]|nr:cell division protein FtsZ [Chitinophagaceae bacterium]
MIHFDLPKAKSSIIKVLGVGGGGSNAVNFMFEEHIEGVDFIICNTDAKAIEQSKVPNKIQLGPHLTQGLGAGANPEVGKMATEESLEEIKRILEVNTKMAFITAGMGGGTGTGGAPIIAQICKDLGILTVGIVTTPFGFEGPRRMAQAEEGIRQLKPYVDTLLVISNDKLRMQYGNLKMKEAFGKADNVLATAAKCITDIINSRGHIIVDFADVCTVMKNGGVAILGSASVEGEDRAQRAIEEALTSPLLNDNDIRGAKWILVNINSAEGEHECTMDELETISSYLRMQAGEHADVIMGMGHDASLDKKIGITLIATGFEHKDPFDKERNIVKPREEKIVMTLDIEAANKPVTPVVAEAPVAATATQQSLPLVDADPFAPRLAVPELETALPEAPMPVEAELEPVQSMEDLMPQLVEETVEVSTTVTVEEEPEVLRFELSTEITEEVVIPTPVAETPVHIPASPIREEQPVWQSNPAPAPTPAVETGFLRKPSTIYVEHQQEAVRPQPATPKVEEVSAPMPVLQQEESEIELQLVEKEVTPAPAMPQMNMDNGISLDNEEEQKRRAAERIQKLRNLSFNTNAADPNNEFDAVPAYIRRNMELFGSTLTSVENFYSKYTVSKDENNQTQISTINTFLDGKKPD